MSEAKAAWDEVGSTFSGLGTKLKLHLEQARSEEQAATEPSADATSAAEDEQAGATKDVKEALRKLGDALDDAFEALGNAAKDPAVKDDVRKVGQTLSGALSATFADVNEELRKAFKRNKPDSTA
jgi:Flp pilus assembly pilin Flp